MVNSSLCKITSVNSSFNVMRNKFNI
ncbi:hypothetical protein Q0A17_07220 [Citrobacter sp. S2-9]|uniref:Uncharacterized protein n=1 Tax=Citrobacter enshiensis TaxID=2971264 RepID=A0ABT8PS93_9ENTR|nr:hypothetical protein [Citrobacter enshiensis]MDN8599198.1 hypothetical protein [Citrobacter enshiensis]WET42730.1 hypothetical protein P2W74_06405 [Citrobacter enshiensis]